MNLIWEAVLSAKNLGWDLDRLDFIPASSPNPYLELSLEDINADQVASPSIEVNVLYRFTRILADCVDSGSLEHPSLKKSLVNLVLHFIAEIDLRQGLSRQEFFRLFLCRETREGVFGPDAAKEAVEFSDSAARCVFHALIRLYQTGFSLKLLGNLLKQIYPGVILYLDLSQGKRLLIYLDRKQTEKLEKQINFLQTVFIPLDYEVILFWEKHFGIIGVNETMVLDEIMIF
jgi:hypothetical protein